MIPMTYDSTADTQQHIRRVQWYMNIACDKLSQRAQAHDQSKLEDPEKPLFDKYTPMLASLTYGSDEYKQCLAEMKVALDHHYAENSHHPEHFPDGIRGMSLLDLVEMLCDWKAATERTANGDLARSIEQNQERFGYGDELRVILENTARELGLF